MRLLTLVLAAAAWTFGNPVLAAAGYNVQQTVLYGGSMKSEAVLSWRVTEREFRLDVTRGSDTRNFVFNGRTFYVCGKLGQAQLALLKKLALDDKDLMSSLAKGACQELATDFSARFFLSPYEAVGDVDMSGGFGSTLDIGEPQINLTGSAQSVGGAKCVDVKRSYTVKIKGNAKAERILNESACNAPSIKWRQTMSREIGMTMMRQAGGQPNFKAMNADLKKNAGMSLKTSGKVTGTAADGKPINRTFEVSSSKAGAGDVAETEVAMPKGFEIIDPKNLAGLAAKAKIPAAKGGKAPGAEDVVRALILGATL